MIYFLSDIASSVWKYSVMLRQSIKRVMKSVHMFFSCVCCVSLKELEGHLCTREERCSTIL